MRKPALVATAFFGALGMTAAISAAAGAAPPERITICHGTASATNPYVEITVSEKSFKDGHFDTDATGYRGKSHGANNNPDFVLAEGATCADGPGGPTTTTTAAPTTTTTEATTTTTEAPTTTTTVYDGGAM